MPGAGAQPGPSIEGCVKIMELIGSALTPGSLDEFGDKLLSGLCRIIPPGPAVLYVSDSRLFAPLFLQCGADTKSALELEKQCAAEFERITAGATSGSDPVSAGPGGRSRVGTVLFPLLVENACIGVIGVSAGRDRGPAPGTLWQGALRLVAGSVDNLVAGAMAKRRLDHLNSYLTVSSMLAQSLGLHEILEAAVYCCMEVVSAEAGSVLLLDDDKTNFIFYQVEGAARPVLQTATFPVDKGLAGSVLETQEAEIVNDVHRDPRFYGKIDSDSGFRTRNMIIVPLTAGEEKVGILEVLNKVGEDAFTEEDRRVLLLMAEEIAFAIRNAKVFEYVVNNYCRQRQGQISCRGCKRPLGRWTPCAKYREAVV